MGRSHAQALEHLGYARDELWACALAGDSRAVQSCIQIDGRIMHLLGLTPPSSTGTFISVNPV